jgi:hypothetical protein
MLKKNRQAKDPKAGAKKRQDRHVRNFAGGF